jgi:hypothetical protein
MASGLLVCTQRVPPQWSRTGRRTASPSSSGVGRRPGPSSRRIRCSRARWRPGRSRAGSSARTRPGSDSIRSGTTCSRPSSGARYPEISGPPGRSDSGSHCSTPLGRSWRMPGERFCGSPGPSSTSCWSGCDSGSRNLLALSRRALGFEASLILSPRPDCSPRPYFPTRVAEAMPSDWIPPVPGAPGCARRVE